MWENDNRSSALIRFLANGDQTATGGEMWWKKWVQSYLACVSFVDYQVGVILDQLEKRKENKIERVVSFSTIDGADGLIF